MKKLAKVENLKKGDIITLVEVSPIWDPENGACEDTTFTHKFKITRENKKTYSCEYVEGAFKGMGFKWIKGYDLTTAKNKEYFI